MSRLLRVLGVGFGLAVTIGNTVGAGILRAPGEVAAQLPRPGPFLLVWVAGGLYALLGAVSLSELGAMMPRSGGYYVFARRALGDFPAFVVGWTDWLATCGTIATGSILAAEYAADIFPALAGRQVTVACLTALLLALLQARGIRWGSWVQGLTTASKGLALLALVAACLLLTPAAAPPAAGDPVFPQGTALAVAVLVALQGVIYAYDGWYGVIYFGEEVKHPGRDVPRSMIGGVLLVTALYLLVNLALAHVLPLPVMAGQSLAAGAAGARLFGESGDTLIRALAIICLVSGITACHLMASRIPLALARDRLLPARFTAVNAGGTPTLGLAFSTAAALFFIVSGSFRQVMALMAFFFVANYVAAFLAVFVLRRREPQAHRPYRAWGYPYTTSLALLISLCFLAGAMAGDTANSLRSLLLLAASYPVYRLVRRLGGAWNPP